MVLATCASIFGNAIMLFHVAFRSHAVALDVDLVSSLPARASLF